MVGLAWGGVALLTRVGVGCVVVPAVLHERLGQRAAGTGVYSGNTATAPEPTTRSRTSRLWFSKLPAIQTAPWKSMNTGSVPAMPWARDVEGDRAAIDRELALCDLDARHVHRCLVLQAGDGCARLVAGFPAVVSRSRRATQECVTSPRRALVTAAGERAACVT
jgi:hypothetical protein